MRYEVTLVDLQEQPAAVVHGHVADDSAIAGFLGSAFGEIMGVVQHEGLRPAGAPFSRYRHTEDGGWDIEAGFPVKGSLDPRGRVEPGTLPGGKVAKALYAGDYGGVADAYHAAVDWIIDNGMVPSKEEAWECYLDDPEVPVPRTEIFIPCQRTEPVHH